MRDIDRWFVVVMLVLIGAAARADETPPPKAVVTIRAADQPMQMDAVKALLTNDPSRLSGEAGSDYDDVGARGVRVVVRAADVEVAEVERRHALEFAEEFAKIAHVRQADT